MASIVRKDLKDRIKNDTFESVEFTIQDGGGSPIDLTGVSIRIQFRFRKKTGAIVKDMSLGSGITLTDATNGIFTIDKFTPVDYEVDTYFYDAEITFTSGDIHTYVQGTFKVIQDTTFT